MDPRLYAYEQRLAAYQQQRAEYEQQRVAEFESQTLRAAEYDFRKAAGAGFDPPPSFHYGLERQDDGYHFGSGVPSFAGSPPTDHQQLRQQDIAVLQQYFGNGQPAKRPYEEVMAAPPGMAQKKPRPENAARPQRPGEKECAYFMKTGECSFGAACRFDHPAWVPPGGAPGWKDTTVALPERPGEPECSFYKRTGMCKFGGKCKFHHPRNHKPLVGMRSIDAAALKWALSEGLDPEAIFQLIRSPPLATALSAPSRTLRSFLEGQEGGVGAEYGGGPQAAAMAAAQFTMGGGASGGGMGGAAGLAPGAYGAPAQLNSRGLPMRPDEPECAFYVKSGSCKYGASCKFDHPEGVPLPGSLQSSVSLPSDLQENWLSQGIRQFPERPGQPECAFYMKTGQCKFGPTCRFHHPRRTPGSTLLPASKGAAAPVKLTLAGLPRREGEQACAYYMKTGACRYGPTCKFDHPPPGEAAAKAMAEQAKKESGADVAALPAPGPEDAPLPAAEAAPAQQETGDAVPPAEQPAVKVVDAAASTPAPEQAPPAEEVVPPAEPAAPAEAAPAAAAPVEEPGGTSAEPVQVEGERPAEVDAA